MACKSATGTTVDATATAAPSRTAIAASLGEDVPPSPPRRSSPPPVRPRSPPAPPPAPAAPPARDRWAYPSAYELPQTRWMQVYSAGGKCVCSSVAYLEGMRAQIVVLVLAANCAQKRKRQQQQEQRVLQRHGKGKDRRHNCMLFGIIAVSKRGNSKEMRE
eukprot:1157521-Pelagomonas_calceolata.AAC.14